MTLFSQILKIVLHCETAAILNFMAFPHTIAQDKLQTHLRCSPHPKLNGGHLELTDFSHAIALDILQTHSRCSALETPRDPSECSNEKRGFGP